MQSMFARDWPLLGYYAIAGILGVVAVIIVCQPSTATFSDGYSLLTFAVALLGAPVLGILVSLPFVPAVIGPLYHLRGRLNGAPYSVGDRVRILAGPYSGRVVRVYEVWSERNQVRVELGDQTKIELADVFSCIQVCRVSGSP